MQAKTIYTICVLVCLAAFEHIVVGLFPPLFSIISNELNISISQMGFVSGITIIVTSFSAILWGAIGGKFNSKILLMVGTGIWVLSVFATSYVQSFSQLLLCQFFTGIGLGCISSIGFSVLTDSISVERRGMVLSFWGMSQGFGGIIGAIVASIIGTAISWRTPFFILGVIGLVLLICYLFIEVPSVGKTEPELKPLLDKGGIYEHKFTFSQIKEVGLKKSNVFLFLQALFLNITIGSLIWVPTLYISKIEGLGFSSKTAIIAASFLYGIFQIGGLTSTYFGYIGDQIQRKTLKGRAIFTGSVLFLMIPFYFLLFSLPMKNLELPANHDSILILLMLLKQIFFNHWMFILLVIAFVASAVQSANTPNWLALITDVNLPEHRGVVFSIGNLMSSIGRTIGNVGVGLLLPLFSSYLNQQQSYIYTLSTLLLFIIPASLCYLFMAKRNVADIKNVKYILCERVKKLKANE